MERTTGKLGNAYFAHLCFDQAINEVRIPCLADMREEKKDMTLLIDCFSPLTCDLTD